MDKAEDIGSVCAFRIPGLPNQSQVGILFLTQERQTRPNARSRCDHNNPMEKAHDMDEPIHQHTAFPKMRRLLRNASSLPSNHLLARLSQTNFCDPGSGNVAKLCQSFRGQLERPITFPKLVDVWSKWSRVAWDDSTSGLTWTRRRRVHGCTMVRTIRITDQNAGRRMRYWP